MSGLSERWWVTVAVFLLALIVAGIAFLSTRGGRGEFLAIRLSHSPRVELEVYVGGAVDAPGVYPFREGDILDDLLLAAGGITPGADPGRVRVIVLEEGRDALPQRIDINTA